MVTKAEIVSLAFTKLGRAPISDIDPFSAPSEVVSASKEYDLLVLKTLAEHPWRFAMLTKSLNKFTDAPPIDEFTTAYILPVDYINLRRTRPNAFYRIFENHIFTNESQSFEIDYTAKLDESRFPSWFSVYMIYFLAANIAMMVTQNVDIAKLWASAAKDQLLTARYNDSQQQPNDVIRNDAILASHFGDNSTGRVF